MTKLQRAIERTLKRLGKKYAHLGAHQGYEALALLLLELGKEGKTR